MKLKQVCEMVRKDKKITPETHTHLMTLVSLWLNINAKVINQSVIGDYIKTTETFITRVQTRWEDIDEESIFQALRNVWIMNAIQMMAGQPFELTDAMFAYSMLYPLTDNLMDTLDISMHEKRVFVEKLGQRLRGEQIYSNNRHESDVFEMVSLIEFQYPRLKYPEIYESLLQIHKAQVDSLEQQNSSLSMDTLKYLTFNKGAASVVADGYLVLGTLSNEQLDFLIGYGIVLQLADDLQDMKIDASVNHSTLFSTQNSLTSKTDTLKKLIYFSSLTLEKIVTQNVKFSTDLKSLLSSSMTLLIGDAVHEQKEFFSKNILKYIESMQVVSLTQHANLKKIGKQYFHSGTGQGSIFPPSPKKDFLILYRNNN
ncbi:hypothetical protein [Fusibacter tunisiensis]|nr:hypothetical protein [Fusibacter tunisiensis]